MQKPARIAFWTLAILFGGAQTWYTRHRIFSDGISYFQIARQYADGDWHGALNAYWSPLYSLVIAFYLTVFRPEPYWQAAAFHVINFAAFLGSCFVYEKFVGELIRRRPAGWVGLSDETLRLAGYVAILHGGLLMVGMAYVSPDMIAFLLTGLAAWLMLRTGTLWVAALLGVTLGLAYLDRAAFAPLNVVYLAAIALWLAWKRSQLLVCALCLCAVAAPFVIGISTKRGSWTLGKAGTLNIGWEVNGAARWTHWQGEPGNIGTPLHPTRLVMKDPVPVYEFGAPVAGAYPPWYDPSYWYDGIQPRLDLPSQVRVVISNMVATCFYLATSPIVGILALLFLATLGRAFQPWRWPAAYWAVMAPALATLGMYCLVYSEKRYIAGAVLVLSMTALAGAGVPPGYLGRHADFGVRAILVLFVLATIAWLAPQVRITVLDLAMRREAEWNASWKMASELEKLGVKPGDRVAYVGPGFEADWVRLAGGKIVAEVPVRHDRDTSIRRLEDENEVYTKRFFQLDAPARERVYQAFRQAGAVIAVTNHIPSGGNAGDWKPVLDVNAAGYPKSGGQVLFQTPGYYRWLNR